MSNFFIFDENQLNSQDTSHLPMRKWVYITLVEKRSHSGQQQKLQCGEAYKVHRTQTESSILNFSEDVTFLTTSCVHATCPIYSSLLLKLISQHPICQRRNIIGQVSSWLQQGYSVCQSVDSYSVMQDNIPRG